MKIISKAEAKTAGLKRYFTGEPCKRGHVAEQYVSTGGCVECKCGHDRKRYSTPEYREKRRERNSTPEGREKQRKHNRTPEARGRRCEYARTSEAREKQRERDSTPGAREGRREGTRRWQKENPERVCAYNSHRRALKKNATPPLNPAEQAEIDSLYEFAAIMKKITGEAHHVDHIHSLSNGGEHRPRNMQVLPAKENLAKNDNDLAWMCGEIGEKTEPLPTYGLTIAGPEDLPLAIIAKRFKQ